MSNIVRSIIHAATKDLVTSGAIGPGTSSPGMRVKTAIHQWSWQPPASLSDPRMREQVEAYGSEYPILALDRIVRSPKTRDRYARILERAADLAATTQVRTADLVAIAENRKEALWVVLDPAFDNDRKDKFFRLMRSEELAMTPLDTPAALAAVANLTRSDIEIENPSLSQWQVVHEENLMVPGMTEDEFLAKVESLLGRGEAQSLSGP